MFTKKFASCVCKLDRNLFHTSKKLLQPVAFNPEVDFQYLTNPKNLEEIRENIRLRKGRGDIQLVHALKEKLDQVEAGANEYTTIKEQLITEMLKIPNKTHVEVSRYKEEPKVLQEVGNKRSDSNLIEFQEIAKRLKLIRTDQLGNVSGSKSYYLLGELAELEHALINYVVSHLIKNKFELVSVPDILHRDIIESCGMDTRGARTMVYKLDETIHGGDLFLSGTSEMALAAYLANKNFPLPSLPLRLAAVSRCYRAETSNLLEERGIYRVHEFSKVEMFVVSSPDQSNQLLEEILAIQKSLFEKLDLCFKVLDMPPHELGAPAFRKYDIEAWLAGRKTYGEISSCSNCLDFQARRLGIRCGEDFVHTLNGTACAVPRLLIALIENGQGKGEVHLPEVLWKFMRGKRVIGKQKSVPELRLVKKKK